MTRVKKDIMKCNFPTKVKFMGLPEKKVMFLTKTFSVKISGEKAKATSIPLSPMDASNIESIQKTLTIGKDAARAFNWDKMCILGIYIRFQPNRNDFNAAAVDKTNGEKDPLANAIVPIECTYTLNNASTSLMSQYDALNMPNKQVFTFGSNEAFTIYIPAPSTMETISATVHRPKTWWSLADLSEWGVTYKESKRQFVFDEDSSEEGDDYGAVVGNGNLMHAGRLALRALAGSSASYNITINFKVALKG